MRRLWWILVVDRHTLEIESVRNCSLGHSSRVEVNFDLFTSRDLLKSLKLEVVFAREGVVKSIQLFLNMVISESKRIGDR